MENENVPKQIKINQNILKMLTCIENIRGIYIINYNQLQSTELHNIPID